MFVTHWTAADTHNEYGQHQYPRYRFFKACTDVFKADGRSVPIFSDKHLSWKYSWAEEMVRESKELGCKCSKLLQRIFAHSLRSS